jgi:hypothetical protein
MMGKTDCEDFNEVEEVLERRPFLIASNMASRRRRHGPKQAQEIVQCPMDDHITDQFSQSTL